MLGIVFALLAALAYSTGSVIVKKRLLESSFLSIALVINIIGNIIFWPFALVFTNLRMFNPEGLIFFVIAGLLSPGIAGIIYFKGIEILGVSINTPVFAIHPMFVSIIGVFLLGESLVLQNWIGIVFVFFGAVYVGRSTTTHETKHKGFKKELVLPLLTALLVAISYIVRKNGLNIFNDPLLGVTIGYSSALVVYLPLFTSSKTIRDVALSKKSFKLLWKAGICMAFGWILNFYALSLERVSIITPLMATEPLFVALLSYLYLKELEQLSVKIIVGTILTVMGIILISFY